MACFCCTVVTFLHKTTFPHPAIIIYKVISIKTDRRSCNDILPNIVALQNDFIRSILISFKTSHFLVGICH